jgi:Ca2+-binding RTX toxin-like protein
VRTRQAVDFKRARFTRLLLLSLVTLTVAAAAIGLPEIAGSSGIGFGCSASTPDLVTDTGQSQTDNLTNDNTPAFGGTYSGNCTAINLYAGSTVVATDNSLSGGTWSVGSTTPLADGSHDMRARGSGRSAYSAILAIRVDTVAPAVSVADLTAASDTGTSNTDNLTHDVTPAFAGTSFGANTVWVRAVGATTREASRLIRLVGSWNVTLPQLAVGSYEIQTRASDSAGNFTAYGASGSLNVTIELPPFCNGVRATIVATSASESIVGTPGNDVIHAFGGADTISPGAGNDIVCAGDGSDLILDGPGADLADGGQGGDRVSFASATGNMDIRLPTGEASGEAAGQDLFYIEHVTGSPFNDFIQGHFAANVLDGGDGHDQLLGNTGNDLLIGGNGSDQLNGNAGTDTCDGGPHPSGLTDSQLNCESVSGIP